MNTLKLPCNVGEVSDGYHTFNELYEHRNRLFLLVMESFAYRSWISKLHSDGSKLEGWFLAGMDLRTGTITYHLPDYLWDLAVQTKAEVLERAPEWDGHTSSDVLERITKFLTL